MLATGDMNVAYNGRNRISTSMPARFLTNRSRRIGMANVDCIPSCSCGKPTPLKLRGTCKPRAPEIDHRVPIAMGGAHTYDNVQCACRECNQRKGGTVIVGQLPLLSH